MILSADDLRAAGYDPTCACGGTLVFCGKPDAPGDSDDRWETIEEYHPAEGSRCGMPLPTRRRKCSVIACSDCEMVIDVSDEADRASIVKEGGEYDRIGSAHRSPKALAEPGSLPADAQPSAAVAS